MSYFPYNITKLTQNAIIKNIHHYSFKKHTPKYTHQTPTIPITTTPFTQPHQPQMSLKPFTQQSQKPNPNPPQPNNTSKIIQHLRKVQFIC